MTYTASPSTLPSYPCDICGQEVEPGERVSVTDNGLTVEHITCVSHWRRVNFGRETLGR